MRDPLSFQDPKPFTPMALGTIIGTVFYLIILFVNKNFPQVPLRMLIGQIQAATYILFFWGTVVILFKWILLKGEKLPFAKMEAILCKPGRALLETTNELNHILEDIESSGLKGKSALSRTIELLIERCRVTKTSEGALEIFKARMDTLQNQISASTAVLRFIASSIPALGFIGTVIGISAALGVPDMVNNLPEVLKHLATAFDTTFVALVLSIPLTLMVYGMQKREEQLLVSIEFFCQEKIIINLRIRG
ncbi:MAG: MotA/TolQ/ExbB proton channel family protein [Planctomycetota bacterium]